MGRLDAVIEGYGEPEQKTTRYTYTPSGQKQTVIKPDGQQITYGYDKWDRLSFIRGGEISYEYTYDEMSRPVVVTDVTNQTATLKIFRSRAQLS